MIVSYLKGSSNLSIYPDLYHIWQGIWFFWGPNGPAQTVNSPDPRSNNPCEAAASRLLQTHLSDTKCQTDIERNLDPL